MGKEAVIVLDCGATNIRAIAVDCNSNILAAKSFANHTFPDPHVKGGKIWDVDHILSKLAEASRHICAELGGTPVTGVCTTSFGVDGAPFDSNGNMLYPAISWACERTVNILDEVHEVFPLSALHRISGLSEFHFNTLYKLYWLKKYRKDILDRTHRWLFMPAVISTFLGAEVFTDVSMLGTSMFCDRSDRRLSPEILSAFGFEQEWFPRLVEAGENIGYINSNAAQKTGIPSGTPIFAAGHDTQFAIYGSEAGVNEPVLSSGTWEILMVRTPAVNVGERTMKAGITTELDAIPGLYNPGIQWLGSKHIEELRQNEFSDLGNREEAYNLMIHEARQAESSRGRSFRSLLEELSEKTRDSLLLLEEACGFKAESLIVVGGGSKNSLWNEIRSQTLGIDISTIQQAETTVIGAARIIFEKLKRS
jgi:L-fuculokinase